MNCLRDTNTCRLKESKEGRKETRHRDVFVEVKITSGMSLSKPDRADSGCPNTPEFNALIVGLLAGRL